MKRLVLGLLGVAAVLVAVAPKALAHGGQFRGPGGNVPPGLREPNDPNPPPPPPTTTPPSGPPTTTPPSGAPPVVTPTDPGGNTAPVPPTTGDTGPTPSSGPKKTPTSFDQWVFWWNNNNDDILRIKDAIYGFRGTSQNPFGAFGDPTSGNRSDATQATEKQVKDTLIPALFWAMDHANKQSSDTESAAYIALAKVTDDPEHVKVLMGAVYGSDGKPNTSVDQVVRESAALSLGLLHRARKERQFDAKLLDQVRNFCFTAFEDESLQIRTRCFAMLSIGVLGDQPTLLKAAPMTGGGLFYEPDPASMGTTAVDRIYDLMRRKYSNEDFYVSLLLALSLQDPTEVGRKADLLEVLKDCALKGKLFKESVSDIVASYGALALGRVGTKDYAASMLRMLGKQTSVGPNVKRSTAIALGQLGLRVSGAERAQLAVDLWKALDETSDPSAKNFGYISLAYMVMADVKAKATDIFNAKGVNVADALLDLADKRDYAKRPYGALSIALIGRAIGNAPDIAVYGDYKVKCLKVLRAGLEDKKLDPRARAAFAVSLGIIKDDERVARLTEIVADEKEDRELRGYAALALGMIGIGSKEVEKSIIAAMKEHTSEELRSQTAVALGLLGSRSAVETLLTELKGADSQNVKGQIVIALAKIGDGRTIAPLVNLLKSDQSADMTRALACAGLGLIGDLEMIPSLSRISKDINFRAATDVINEVLSIL
jgi:HEAT repeat protein